MARSRGAPICPKISKVQIFGSFLLVTVAVGSFLAVAVGAPFAGAGGTKSSRSMCHTTLVAVSVDRRRSLFFRTTSKESQPNSYQRLRTRICMRGKSVEEVRGGAHVGEESW